MTRGRGRAAATTPSGDEVVVVLIGASHNGSDGAERTVSPEKAKSLVERRLARYRDPVDE